MSYLRDDDEREPIMNELLQSELALADPAAGGEDAELHALVRRLSTDAREASLTGSATRMPWWKRRRAIGPIGIAGIVALTGAAVLVPLGLRINGTQVDLDAEIPIVYTTDTGVDVSCRWGIVFGDPVNRSAADERLAEFVENRDWTGIGQRIYEEAIANPFVPGPNDDWEVDNQELRDYSSFNNALNLVIWEEIPASLLAQEGQSAGATSDCTGKLR